MSYQRGRLARARCLLPQSSPSQKTVENNLNRMMSQATAVIEQLHLESKSTVHACRGRPPNGNLNKGQQM